MEVYGAAEAEQHEGRIRGRRVSLTVVSAGSPFQHFLSRQPSLDERCQRCQHWHAASQVWWLSASERWGRERESLKGGQEGERERDGGRGDMVERGRTRETYRYKGREEGIKRTEREGVK